jgi:hypothetical protein
MKQAEKVAAALEIVTALRRAVGSAQEERQAAGWDSQILLYETARALALLLRREEATPSELDDVLRFLRQVYAGVYPTAAMSLEDALATFCAAETGEDAAVGGGGSGDRVVH